MAIICQPGAPDSELLASPLALLAAKTGSDPVLAISRAIAKEGAASRLFEIGRNGNPMVVAPWARCRKKSATDLATTHNLHVDGHTRCETG